MNFAGNLSDRNNIHAPEYDIMVLLGKGLLLRYTHLNNLASNSFLYSNFICSLNLQSTLYARRTETL